MTPTEAAARYRRQMASNGEPVMLSRLNAAGTFGPILARVTNFLPDDVVMDVQQGDRKMLLLAADVAASGFPLPLRKNDRVLWNGKVLPIKDVDDATRRLAGVLLAYEIVVQGS